jgi:hypothetical protein
MRAPGVVLRFQGSRTYQNCGWRDLFTLCGPFPWLILLFGAGQPALAVTTELWRIPLDGPIYASPTVAENGTIYVGSANLSGDKYGNSIRYGKFYSISPSGATNWVVDLVGAIVNTAALGPDGTVYVGAWMDTGAHLNPPNRLYALRPDGTIKWNIGISGGLHMFSSPVVGANGDVYFTGQEAAYSISSGGTTNWICALSGFPGGLNSPGAFSEDVCPSIGPDGTVYVGGPRLHAIDPIGKIKWTFEGGWLLSCPAIGADGAVYAGCGDGLYAINPNGTLRWRLPSDHSGCNSSPAIASDGSIRFAPLSGSIYSVNSVGQSNWLFQPTTVYQFTSPAVTENGNAYWVPQETIYEIQRNGIPQQVLKPALGTYFFCSPVIAPEGVLYVGSEEGTLYAFRLDSAPAKSSWPMYRHDPQHTGRATQIALAVQSEFGNTITLALRVEANQRYSLESSPDLVNWSEILNFTGTATAVRMTYPRTGSSQFYRLRLSAELR